MPPPNLHRRRRLAEAATHVLAEGGSRGLTHRAVDAFAGVPAGTTSRYFRNRDALFVAVTEYAISTHLDDLGEELGAAPAGGRLTCDDLVELLVQTARAAVGEQRFRHLAVAELFLESNRRPALREAMTAAARQHRESLGALFAAAGVPLDELAARRLVAFIDGMLFSALAEFRTAPAEVAQDMVEALVRDELATFLGDRPDRLTGCSALPAPAR
ncbi:TetR/AcrR family transcriptional regulator [Pseudonocardia sp. CA-107938]|uniref:TetR/AcrR family transcriptional regulator n=1 Tax=Pseudonocardia sp. CA-107938 TaxID=3240021 RepID=UPI003D915584